MFRTWSCTVVEGAGALTHESRILINFDPWLSSGRLWGAGRASLRTVADSPQAPPCTVLRGKGLEQPRQYNFTRR